MSLNFTHGISFILVTIFT